MVWPYGQQQVSSERPECHVSLRDSQCGCCLRETRYPRADWPEWVHHPSIYLSISSKCPCADSLSATVALRYRTSTVCGWPEVSIVMLLLHMCCCCRSYTGNCTSVAAFPGGCQPCQLWCVGLSAFAHCGLFAYAIRSVGLVA